MNRLQIDRNAGLQRAIEQIRLGEAERDVVLQRSDLRLQGERFAQAEEVVGGIVQADERSGDAGNAAVQADRILAALLDLQRDVDRVGARVALQFVGFVFLQGFEIAELIQAQDTGIPEGASCRRRLRRSGSRGG